MVLSWLKVWLVSLMYAVIIVNPVRSCSVHCIVSWYPMLYSAVIVVDVPYVLMWLLSVVPSRVWVLVTWVSIVVLTSTNHVVVSDILVQVGIVRWLISLMSLLIVLLVPIINMLQCMWVKMPN